MKNILKYGVFTILTLSLGVALLFQTNVEATALDTNSQEQFNTTIVTPDVDTIETTSETVSTEEETNFEEEGSAGSETKGEGMAFRATCYCLRGKTASGAMVRRGIVAADPRILPLGTRISVSNAGRYSGTYLVADTGGVIKGKILDIWVPSCGEAIAWGRRGVTVSVVGRGGKATKAKADKAAKPAKVEKEKN
jgi:3D (Asp-Asp-Asp) domain-containing protein